SALFKRANSAIREQKPFAVAALEEYFNTFSESMEKIRIAPSQDECFDDILVQNIQSFIPSRNELFQIIDTASRYMPADSFSEQPHKTCTSLPEYLHISSGHASYYPPVLDNIKFIIGEMYQYVVTILIQNNKIRAASTLTNQPYYTSKASTGNPSLTNCERL